MRSKSETYPLILSEKAYFIRLDIFDMLIIYFFLIGNKWSHVSAQSALVVFFLLHPHPRYLRNGNFVVLVLRVRTAAITPHKITKNVKYLILKLV